MTAHLISAPLREGRPPVDVSYRRLGVVSGTGPQGRGLAVRLAAGGQRVLLGRPPGMRGIYAGRLRNAGQIRRGRRVRAAVLRTQGRRP